MGDTRGEEEREQQQSFVLVICLMVARPSDIKWLPFWLGLAWLGVWLWVRPAALIKVAQVATQQL